MELIELLAQLEEAVDAAPRVPLTGKALIDPEELFALIEELRATLPSDLSEAARWRQEREATLAEAREEAEALVREARAFAAQLTDETAIAREAQARADEIIDQSKRVAREIRVGAREYADEVLRNLEESYNQELQLIRRHREELAGGR